LAGIEAEVAAGRVSTLELFFDLVFVFTITQLTAVLYHDPSWRSLLQVVVMLAVIWWMYAGYAWLTNAVVADTVARRLFLLGGMAGYFVLALAIPDAFEGSGLAFALAYLVIVSVHTALFTRAASATIVTAILRLAPWNLTSALVVLVGGALGGTAQYVLWTFAALFEWMTPILRRGARGFGIGAAHFVERHGLVVIVAIGESVIAVGIGASHLAVDVPLVVAVTLGLALSACLWWLYFGGSEERAERALAEAPPVVRAHAALFGFGYAHMPILLGIVTTAAAERRGLEQPFDRLSWWNASLLAGGVALFLAGDVWFRRVLHIGRVHIRAVMTVLALAALPLGAWVSAVAAIAALVTLLAIGIVTEARLDAPPPREAT
jgi:low temperature requirement protein LtrA